MNRQCHRISAQGRDKKQCRFRNLMVNVLFTYPPGETDPAKTFSIVRSVWNDPSVRIRN